MGGDDGRPQQDRDDWDEDDREQQRDGYDDSEDVKPAAEEAGAPALHAEAGDRESGGEHPNHADEGKTEIVAQPQHVDTWQRVFAEHFAAGHECHDDPAAAMLAADVPAATSGSGLIDGVTSWILRHNAVRNRPWQRCQHLHVVLCTYTIAAYRPRVLALAGLGVLVTGVVLTAAVQHAPAVSAFGGGLMACVVWLLGQVVRRQRDLGAELETALARLAAEHDSRALLAPYDERARIARDLHALVAQLVTTMVIQAQAADDLIDTDPSAAVDAIRRIEQTGRAALAQMRQMLGVLRNNPDPAPTPPMHERPTEVAPGMLLAVPS